MSLDETLTIAKAQVHDRGADVVAKEIGVHVDTLRTILSSAPPRWVTIYRGLETMAAKTNTGQPAA